MDTRPALAECNSSNSEQFNAWLELFVPLTRSMRLETYDVFLILLAHLWIEAVVPKRDAGTFPVPLDRGSRWKRRRRSPA